MTPQQVSAHIAASKAIGYFALLAGLVAGVVIFFVVSSLVAGDWNNVTGFGAGFLGLAIIGGIGQEFAKRRELGLVDQLFPGHSGEKVPAYLLLGLRTGEGDRLFDSPLHNAMLHDANDRIFAKRSDSSSDSANDFANSKFVLRPNGLTIWAPRKSEVAAIELAELTEASFARATGDGTPLLEKLVMGGFKTALGLNYKTKITPFVALLILHIVKDGQPENMTFAIPVSASPKHLLNDDANEEQIADWWRSAVSHASDKALAFASERGMEIVTTVVGEAITDTISDLSGYHDEINAIMSAGTDEIDDSPRLAALVIARIVAERVRRMVGLEQVEISAI